MTLPGKVESQRIPNRPAAMYPAAQQKIVKKVLAICDRQIK